MLSSTSLVTTGPQQVVVTEYSDAVTITSPERPDVVLVGATIPSTVRVGAQASFETVYVLTSVDLTGSLGTMQSPSTAALPAMQINAAKVTP